MATTPTRTGTAPETGVAPAAGERPRYLPIGDYAAIGDGAAVCLLARDGAVDWMCVPYLEGEAVFSRLIDAGSGGYFELRPTAPFEASREYVEDTNVLQTTFSTAEGKVRLTDALTLGTSGLAPGSELVRRIDCLSGEVQMRTVFRPALPTGERFRFDSREGWLLATRGPLQLAVRGWDAGELAVEDWGAAASFELGAGQSALIAMLAGAGEPLALPRRERCESHLEETAGVWRARARGIGYDGPWSAAVRRSLLALGLLTDARTGAIAAAGTTSLPETVGGSRNYDYRFGWVRDLSFTLDALIAIGAEEQTAAGLGWLLSATKRTHPRVDPVYTLDGDVLRSQHAIDAAGYRDSRPVNAGNAAGSQLQLGGFGDLLEAVANFTAAGNLLPRSAGERLADQLNLLCAIWRNPDAGLWELSDRAQYTSSKIGCWTAFRRGVELADAGLLPSRHAERWARERDAVASFVDSRLWSEARGAYLMSDDGEALDCATLLAARRGFRGAGERRLERTVDAIVGELDAGSGLLYRYSGMREEENAFLACSYWLVEALMVIGRTEQATELMDRVTGLANDVGLFSEEIEPGSGELRGNFPQALTHLALISAASSIAAADAR